MATTTTVALARERIARFAEAHKLVFEDRGEVGFGRPCVGLRHGDKYVDYWPYRFPDFEPVTGFEDPRVGPPASVNDAYHKHACLAVLVQPCGEGTALAEPGGDGDVGPCQVDYDRAILQLADWVAHLEEVGVEVAAYETGATGVQALFSGVIGYAVRVRPEAAR